MTVTGRARAWRPTRHRPGPCYQKAIDLGFDAKEELEELDKAAPAGAAEQPKKKKSFLGRLFGK